MQDTFDKIKKFCLLYKRYIGAFGLFVVFVLVLRWSSVDQTDIQDGEEIEAEVEDSETEWNVDGTEIESVVDSFEFDKEYKVDSDDKMISLLKDYYTAYTSNDMDALEKVAYPVSDSEKSYIAVLSKYYEKIDKFSYYSKAGLKEGTYFVSVSNEIKFEGIEKTAPALDFFYVETDAEGNLFIDNAYSIFNLNFMDNTVDSDIYASVQKYMQQPDFVELQQQVQSKYDEALSKDKDLTKMIQNTLDGAIKEWAVALQKPSTEETTENKEENTQEAQKEEEKPKEEQKLKEENTSAATNQKTKVKTKDIVNVRAAASTDSQQIGQFTEGAELTKIGEDGDWTIIEFQGGKGYVKSEFLK